jgi:leucyl aminopeptidase
MYLDISASPLNTITADILVAFVASDEALFNKTREELCALFPSVQPTLDAATASGDFTAKKDSVLLMYLSAPSSAKTVSKTSAKETSTKQPGRKFLSEPSPQGTDGNSASSPRLLLVGLGEIQHVSRQTLRSAAATAGKFASGKKLTSAALLVPYISTFELADIAELLTEGIMLTAYKFTKYFSGKDAPKGNTIERLTLIVSEHTAPEHMASSMKKSEAEGKVAKKSTKSSALQEAKHGALYAQAVSEGVLLARALANAPNNEIYPETLAQAAERAAKEAGFSLTVLEKKKIAALKMNGLLTVNKGSERPPVFLVMEYRGAANNEAPIVLIGKGVTFDTGGISIKPAAGMGEMKSDMHGAASVIGTIYAAAKLKLKRNIVALVPATDNMPSGSAVVPGDVITYSNGLTVEVDNTDAEGRLILADALIYAQQYNPQAVIDLATLTGACVVALGTVTSGLFGTDETLKARLKAAADYTNEYVCELPLYAEYEELIKSDIADIKNTGGRYAGAITAALFLKRFTKLPPPSTPGGASSVKRSSGRAVQRSRAATAASNTADTQTRSEMPWAHLDIAGTAILPADTAYMPKGGSGVGVRLLCQMLRAW